MKFIYDRLYGKVDFPRIVTSLLSSPELLRLRGIGQGNVKFISFPSFSTVTRYEHSLGVCHLAKLASESLKLSEKDELELMIAALYHDITSPPFAHATEEILKRYFGFDHEKHLYDLILGRTEDLGRLYFQIFMGKSLRLRSFCQSSQARKVGIDLFRILAIILGEKDELLSQVVKGDIDIDNIDNVIRAASAMGIQEANGSLSESLAKSFIFHKEIGLAISADAAKLVDQWKELRRILYEMILCSVEDFSLQTMLKHGLTYLAESGDTHTVLRESDWKLTEEQMIEKMKQHREARKIVERMELRDLYLCLSLVWIRGPNALEHIERKKKDLEELAKEELRISALENHYLDKRHRMITRPLVFLDEAREVSRHVSQEPALLVGFFSPKRTRIDKKTGRNIIGRKVVEEFLFRLRDSLPKDLSLFRVSAVQNKYPHLKLMEEIK